MQPGQHPDAIDTRLVFRIYSWVAIAGGLLVYLWPLKFFPDVLAGGDLAGLPWGRFAVLRTVAGNVVALGMCASGFRRRIETTLSVVVARDLHDAVKQQLFAIQTSAATAQARLTSDTDGVTSALEQVRTSTRDAMTEMEAMIDQLQSAPMENTGLVAALRQHSEALGLRTGAEVTFEAGTLPPSDALPPGTQQALFRAAQEAFANIARHARATHVHVRLRLVGDNFELTIRDDGAGFDPTETATRHGHREHESACVRGVRGVSAPESARQRDDCRLLGAMRHEHAARVREARAAVDSCLWPDDSELHVRARMGAAVERRRRRHRGDHRRALSRGVVPRPRSHGGHGMSALTLTPKRWYSWDFFVLDGARTLANFRLSSWREKGVLEVDGLDYDVYRESPFGDFILQHAGSILARATKPSAFRRSFVIRYKERLVHAAGAIGVQTDLRDPRRRDRGRLDRPGELVHTQGDGHAS